MRRFAPFAALFAALFATGSALAEAPKVVVSIKPIHALVAAVMQGVAEPALLVRGGASPPTYTLKPSDAKSLTTADLVVWVGPEMEGCLEKPLASNARKATVLTLMTVPGMLLLDAREGGAWESHDHGHEHKSDGHKADGKKGDDHDEVNTHIWLDPANARRIVSATADALATKDPANAAAYRNNAERTAQAIDTLDAELKTTLAPIVAKPFVVFHDG